MRPTQDQVRAALFNILGERIAGARLLDLFAGSGAMGIEALSRGAAHVTFVERSGFGAKAIKKNLENLGTPPGTFRIIRADVLQEIPRLAREGKWFDWVILDPPYGPDLARKTLMTLSRCAIVPATGGVVVEHDKRDSLPAETAGESGRLVTQRTEQYGDTALTFLTFDEKNPDCRLPRHV